MKEYVKIKSDRTLMNMPTMYQAHWDIRNDETTQDFCAKHDNWLLKKDTECPEYNPETQYVTFYYEGQEIEGVEYAVQVWEIHDKEEPIEEVVEDE